MLDAPEEQALALLLSRFGEVVAEVGENLQPHKLCAYLYDLATAMSVFYEPVSYTHLGDLVERQHGGVDERHGRCLLYTSRCV